MYSMWASKLLTKVSLTMVRRCSRQDNLFISGKTMKQLKEDLHFIMGVEKGYKPKGDDRSLLNKYLVTEVKDLPPRTIKDSYLYASIPLATDEDLQNKYISNLGVLRLGRLLEDLDIFAVMVLHKYILNPKVPIGEPYPYSIVTASVTSIHFTDFDGKAGEDIRITGHITNVGKSSATIAVWLEQQLLGEWMKITQSYVVLATRDATNSFSCIINPLVPLDDKEDVVIKAAMKQRDSIKMKQNASLMKNLPTNDEQNLIHGLFLSGCGTKISTSQSLSKGCKWMKNSILHSTVFSFPEDRNLHNTVFGGYIMRVAMELARALCIMYSKNSNPKLIGISDISFKKPIAVGSIILMHAHVVYTNLNFLQITVFADAVNRKAEMEISTNTFHLTYKLSENMATKVVPFTYQESMLYIDGMRHFKDVINEGEKLNSLYSPADIVNDK